MEHSNLSLKGSNQGVKVVTLGRQNDRNSSYVRLAHTSIFGLCFMSVCLMKSNCYSLIYSSLGQTLYFILPINRTLRMAKWTYPILMRTKL